MTTMTLAIPEELKSKMEKFPEMNWSAVAREAFSEKVKDMEFLKEFASKSTLTEADAIRLGRKVNESLAKRYGLKSKK